MVNATHARPIRVAWRDAEGSQEVPLGSLHRITCCRGARPSSYIFGYMKARKFTYNIFKITCKNSVSFSPESALRRCLLPVQ